MRTVRSTLVAASVGLLAACTSPPPAPVHAPAVPSRAAPIEQQQLPADGSYTLSAGSALRVRVYRSGSLARLGHNHIVVVPLTGTLTIDQRRVMAIDLTSALADWRLDEPSERALAGAGFESVPDADAIAATRSNMLSDGLLAARAHPVLRIAGSSTPPQAATDIVPFVAEVDLAGQRTRLPIELTIRRDGGQWRAQGATRLAHETLGLTPFTALGGALAVADQLDVLIDVTFAAVSPPAAG